MTSVDSGVHVLMVHYCFSLIIHRLKEHSHFIKWFVTTVSQKPNNRWPSYLGGRWPIMSILFLVLISIIFMSGRGLEVISSNVRYSSIVSLILLKLDLMTSVEGEVHVLVVHHCISLIIHRLKEHTVIYSKKILKNNGRWLSYLGGTLLQLINYTYIIACNHSKSKTQWPMTFILGW